MAPKVVDVDPDNTDSECEEKPWDPQLSSAVTLNEQKSPSVLETSIQHTRADTINVPREDELASMPDVASIVLEKV